MIFVSPCLCWTGNRLNADSLLMDLAQFKKTPKPWKLLVFKLKWLNWKMWVVFHLQSPLAGIPSSAQQTLSSQWSVCCCSVAKLYPHGLQHARLPCPSLSPGVSSESCSLSRWCHPTISSCHPLLLLPSVFPSIRVFSSELALCTRWPKD